MVIWCFNGLWGDHFGVVGYGDCTLSDTSTNINLRRIINNLEEEYEELLDELIGDSRFV